jgi:uncharacterized membrane protein
MRLDQWADGAASVFEAAGLLAMVGGTLLAIALTLAARSTNLRDGLRDFRQRLGRAIVLGLELLVAADILRTMTSLPTLREVAVLGFIVMIRTFLSWSLEVELEGRWPWQPRPAAERTRLTTVRPGTLAATS